MATGKGYESLSVAATSVALASLPAGANMAVMSIENADIRFRVDGVAPTATTGTRADAGVPLTLVGHDVLESFRAIAVSGTATLEVSYA